MALTSPTHGLHDGLSAHPLPILGLDGSMQWMGEGMRSIADPLPIHWPEAPVMDCTDMAMGVKMEKWNGQVCDV